MTNCKRQFVGNAWLLVGSLMGVVALGCGGDDRLSPSVEAPSEAAPATTDSAATDSAAIDSTLLAPDSLANPDSTGVVTVSTLAAGTQPGIVFGSYAMMPSNLTTVHTGTLLGGPIDENNIISVLSDIRSKGGRVVIKLCKGADSFVKNADGTFSLSKWKALVNRFSKLNLDPFINDGTILGHFLIDEPQRPQKWGGKIISQATLEAMAQYSKSIWPNMTTFARVVPSWLASSSVTYRALDAGWLQFTYNKGDAAQLVASETAAAKRKGLGLIVGLNILDGGNGSSKVRGWGGTGWAMSAAEIRNFGSALLSQSYACGFYNWTWQYNGPTYYARTDIKAALTELSLKAKAHVRTSCRQ